MTGLRDNKGDVWLVLADPLSTRLFVDAGVVESLCAQLNGRLVVVVLGDEAEWRDRLGEVRVLDAGEFSSSDVGMRERVVRRVDRSLDRQLGFYPLAIRLNYRHGFHLERIEPGHSNWMLDSTRKGWLPRWRWVERAMQRWHFSPRRYVPRGLLERMRRECAALVLSNVQPHGVVPFLLATRRLELPVVAHVASWDHTVGKGVIAPFCDAYIVQNHTMKEDLERYHRVDPERIVVTGWPQTDVYARLRARARTSTRSCARTASIQSYRSSS